MKEKTSEIVLEIAGLSKQYARNKPNLDLRATLSNSFRKQSQETFWALEDVSFNVQKGDILGIIGKNGSGKSTLLKILSGITKPTSGKVTIQGSIGSILDIGTGFHPDLTGRENVFLSGQLFGLSKKQIVNNIDEIIDFSEIGDFIDTPVKHYSDGMFLRLAFAFFTHFQADLLLFDEVLSVGDIGFQQKCFARIHDIAQQGSTILFVSHSAKELLDICNVFLYLEQGRVKHFGRDPSVLLQYMEETIAATQSSTHASTYTNVHWDNPKTAPGSDLLQMVSIALSSALGEADENLYTDQSLQLDIIFRKLTPAPTLDLVFTISDFLQHEIMACSSHRVHQYYETSEPGIYHTRCWLPANFFNQGTFKLHIFALADRQEICFSLRDALIFKLESRIHYAHTAPNLVNAPIPFAPALQWELSYKSA